MNFVKAAMCGFGLFLSVPDAVSAQVSVHNLTISSDERRALQALEAAARGQDRAAQDAALAAARSVASSSDARHAVAHFQLEIAQARRDQQMAEQAVDALAAGAEAEEMPTLLMNQATRAYYAGEFPQADRFLSRAAELQPNNPALLAELAQLKSQIAGALSRAGRQPEAAPIFDQSVTLIRRAIELRTAAGQQAPESWYRRGLAIAFDHRLPAHAAALGRGLVTHYPSPFNWRDALLSYRQMAAGNDPALSLDVGRLMRASGALAGERDYLELAAALRTAGHAGEEKAVLDEGQARDMLAESEPQVRQVINANAPRARTERSGLATLRTRALAATDASAALAAADTHYGNGLYAEAAELYRAALQKGAQDPGLVNLRLGASLALAGSNAEAQTALRAVTGPRADLAGFWLAWLATRTASTN